MSYRKLAYLITQATELKLHNATRYNAIKRSIKINQLVEVVYYEKTSLRFEVKVEGTTVQKLESILFSGRKVKWKLEDMPDLTNILNTFFVNLEKEIHLATANKKKREKDQKDLQLKLNRQKRKELNEKIKMGS